MSNTMLAAITMQFYAYVNDEGVVEMVLSAPAGMTDPHYVEISENDQSLVGKKLLYYALLDDRDVVTGLIAVANELTDSKKILLITYDKKLVGKWYNRTTKQFTELPIHILAKLSTGEINLVNSDGTPQDKWLQTKLDEMDAKVAQVESTSAADTATKYDELKTKVAQVESTCTADTASKYNELNTKVSKVESTCLADNTAKYNTLDAKASQVQSTCLTDSAVKYNTVNSKIEEVSNGSFGGFKTRFKIDHNEKITTEWTTYGKRVTFNFNSGISGYFPKMIRLVARANDDAFMKADFYIVKNPDGSIRNAYVDKSYISRADGKNKKEYGVSNNGSLFSMSTGSDAGASYFMEKALPSTYYNADIRNFDYTENSFSFTVMPDEAWLNKYTSMSFYGYVY